MAKHKQPLAEEQKTISITETRKLRLQLVRPGKGIIEIVNSADQGRVCTLRAEDFRSIDDALIYAELLRLAPELLDDYLSDAKKLAQVLQRLDKKLARAKGKNAEKKK
ncbi:MAG: hypothetical protein M3R17_13350 [Bacteroidota bacterium]|nr:hypothetical protein [Bacteroidota bacterium]